ncbi:MAG: replication initiator protein [Microvirus sp.]|nr:MAG: replication initiator protein [Microvirus sp.]
MPCYHPQTGYYSKDANPETGRRPIVFSPQLSLSGIPLKLPCGQCIGCKLERSRQWAVRLLHEAKLHDRSAFLTLTYADKNIPASSSLVKTDVQKFMKRLRRQRPTGLRFFACGEYGETTGRPHYHVLLLNTDFPDRRLFKRSKTDMDHLYVSSELSDIWTVGNSAIGNVTFESCAYVARYVTKKLSGPAGAMYYAGAGIEPEFATMSLRPAIGGPQFVKYSAEWYKFDAAVLQGKEVPLPRYYDKLYEVLDPVRYKRVKLDRSIRALKNKAENTLERRRVREAFEERKQRRFAREVS